VPRDTWPWEIALERCHQRRGYASGAWRPCLSHECSQLQISRLIVFLRVRWSLRRLPRGAFFPHGT
jgi:hypothetical protein